MVQPDTRLDVAQQESGEPPINALELDANGSAGMLPTAPEASRYHEP